jgi:hypothetical protein
MSLDHEIRKLVRSEVRESLKELRKSVSEVQAFAAQLGSLRSLATRLGPLLSLGAVTVGVKRRGPGRPPGAVGRAAKGRKAQARRGAPAVNDRPCAIIGCKKKSRTKGYCSAHYQKLRMLVRTKRLPADWVDFAAPKSVKDVVLPRGRAGARALKEARSST